MVHRASSSPVRPATHDRIPLDRTFAVRFGDQEDLVITSPADSSVGELKRKIIESKPSLSSKYLRLLYRGRILNDSILLVTLPRETADVQRMDAGSDKDVRTEVPVYIHCAVSDAPASDLQEPQMNSNEPALGFDRLIEIEQHDPTRSAEEAWIDNRPRPEEDDASTPTTNTTTLLFPAIQDANTEMLVALCCGFLGGILVLFWIKEHGIWTRRQQMGIVLGVVVNFLVGVLRMWTS
ncbi:hypothetical protein HDU98_004354 [Podochytrium sp. JEL0797]|nr:hypothetical protein HDU98_004354 [Podochytrium sp. JEL0797]